MATDEEKEQLYINLVKYEDGLRTEALLRGDEEEYDKAADKVAKAQDKLDKQHEKMVKK